MLDLDQVKAWLIEQRPRYAVDVPAPFEPPQTFLLGGRWADFALSGLMALAFPALRGILRPSIYEPLGRRIMFGKTLKDKLTGKQLDRLKKWNESCWKMTVFFLMTATAFSVSFGQPWFWESRYFWLGCNSFPPCNLSVSKGVLFFYTVETGFYLQSIHFLIFHEVRRKDWLESMIHHVATAALLIYSYYVNFARIGVMILLIHDVSDIFLEAAKLARYARKQNLAVALFIVFMLVWIITRDILFPFYIIRSTLTEPLYYASLFKIETEPHYTIFNGLLILLEILHIYWTYLIVKIAIKPLFGENAKDVRENDDSDDD